MKHSLRTLNFPLLLTAAAATASIAGAHAASMLPPDARVAIIGDSITEQKLYSKYMETYLVACTGRQDIKVFQFGWSGETASGFAGRVENDLGVFKPTVATTCYGMNDGSYRPFDEGIGKNYENNMRTVAKKLAAIGVKNIVLGSPGAVDTKFFGKRPSFGPTDSATGYNDNLAHLRDIARKLSGETQQGFADVHGAMIDTMTKAKAALGENYDVCGGDGFHPGPNGQLIMAYAFLKALGVDGNVGEITIDMSGNATASGGHKVLSATAKGVEIESSRYPFCFDPDTKKSSSTRSITPFLPFNADLNRFTLKAKNLSGDSAKVTWGKETKQFTRAQLESGVNLAAEFSATPFDEAFFRVMNAVGNKQNFETTMIKGLITQFRGLPGDLKSDAELSAAIETIRKRLAARQETFDAEVRKAIVPVKHTITISP